MGQEQSSEDDQNTTETASTSQQRPTYIEDDVSVQSLHAYRVMKVFQGSPASRSGLSSFEDFILAVNGTLVESDKTSLANVLKDNEGKEVALVVYNVVDAHRRDVALRPVKWNGPGLLGAAVRYEPIEGAIDHVLRVIDVLPNSPADEAGLVANTDFIAGSPAEVFRNEGDFTKMVSMLFFFVYILLLNAVRELYACLTTCEFVDKSCFGAKSICQFHGVLNCFKSNCKQRIPYFALSIKSCKAEV